MKKRLLVFSMIMAIVIILSGCSFLHIKNSGVEQKTLLWSQNRGEYGTDNIILNSEDYDLLEIWCAVTNDNNSPMVVTRTPKGHTTTCTTQSLDTSGNSSMGDTFIMQRTFTYVNDITLTPSLGWIYRLSGTDFNGYSYFMIPMQIYGIKSNMN